MILPAHTQRDIRNEVMADALKELRPASFLVAAIAERAHLAAEMERIGKCIDALDRYLDTYEPRRAAAPGAQTGANTFQSPAGGDPVAIPAFLHPRPYEAGLPEVTASGSYSPETANEKKAQPDETLRRVEAGLVVEPSAQSTAVRTDAPHEAGDALGESLTEGAHPARDGGSGIGR